MERRNGSSGTIALGEGLAEMLYEAAGDVGSWQTGNCV